MTTKNEAREGELMPPGIVIRDRQEPQRRPAITAFIWGGKVRPTPSLPFGNKAA